jgi:4-amino-4-deoxy-L-arabinose transferase-like glycosyltransferase
MPSILARALEGADRHRHEATLFAAVVAVAAVLRFWNLTALGLTHFDEGAYTTTGRWLATLGREGAAFQPTFSPPLFPSLVGAAFALFGVRDFVAVAVSAAAGSLTVGIVYLIGRAWFGRAVGVAAALMLAAAEYHVVFSRLALTDATFTLLFWVALACLFRGAEAGDRRWLVAGGVATGLCWNTKYHGFFPLAIVGVWLLARAARGERVPVRDFALASGVAAGMYLPWVVYVQATIGYAALVRTHVAHSVGRGLFVTPPAALAFYFERWLAAPLLVMSAAGVVAAFVERRRAGLFLVLATALFLASATLYLSFPRLALPVVPAACLFAAYGVDAAARALRVRPAATLAVGTALVLAWGAPRAAAVLAMRTDGYRRAAAYVREAGVPAITELSKNYYFYEATPSLEMRFHTREELDAALRSSPEVLVVVDPIVERLPDAKAWLDAARGGLAPERVFPIEMYEPVYYQGFDPTTPLEAVPRSVAPFRPGEASIVVYRIGGTSPSAGGR